MSAATETASASPPDHSLAPPAAAAASESTDDEDDYILTTATHNYVSRNANLQGSKQIDLRGRSIISRGVQVRGDLAWVRVGRYTMLSENVVVEPPPLLLVPQTAEKQYIPVTIGSHTTLCPNVHSQAAAVGSGCWIGAGCRLGPRVILRDGVVVADGVHIPADTVVPPFTRVTSRQAVGNASNSRPCLDWMELPPSITVELQERSMQTYQDLVSQQRRKKEAAS